jgi:hypothetical protein
VPPEKTVVPKPEADAPPAALPLFAPPAPPLARTPVVFEVGAVLEEVRLDVFQFSQVSPPATPFELDDVDVTPPLPIEI